MTNNIEWAFVGHVFPAWIGTREEMHDIDPDNRLLGDEYEWGAAMFLDNVAIYADDSSSLLDWFHQQITTLTAKVDAARPVSERACITMDFLGGTATLTVTELRDLLESDQNIDEALTALSADRYWIPHNRLIEHGPRGYQEFRVSDPGIFAVQLEHKSEPTHPDESAE